MPYPKRYPGGFVDLPLLTTPVDSQFLNAVEAVLAQLAGEAPAVDEVGVWSSAGGGALVYQKITNAQIDNAAAIAKSKLAALNIVDADVAAGASIAKSKLAALNITNSDIAAGAAIAIAKLQGYPADVTKVLKGNGTWGTVSPGMELIQEIVGTGASGVITFSAIPTGYRSLVLQWVARSDAAVASALLDMRFNGVSGATDYLSKAEGGYAYGSSGRLGSVTGANLAGPLGSGEVRIMRPDDVTTHGWHGQWQAKINTSGTASTDLNAGDLAGLGFVNTAQAALASLSVILGSGNFTTTTKFALYGIL